MVSTLVQFSCQIQTWDLYRIISQGKMHIFYLHVEMCNEVMEACTNIPLHLVLLQSLFSVAKGRVGWAVMSEIILNQCLSYQSKEKINLSEMGRRNLVPLYSLNLNIINWIVIERISKQTPTLAQKCQSALAFNDSVDCEHRLCAPTLPCNSWWYRNCQMPTVRENVSGGRGSDRGD